MVFGQLGQPDESTKVDKFKVLLDSGANGSLVTHQLVRNLGASIEKPTVWSTAAGEFKTKGRINLAFKLPELSPTAEVRWDVHVHWGTLNSYNMILGWDILTELGINILFSKQGISCPQFNAEIQMKLVSATSSTHYHVEEQLNIENEAQRLAKVLEAKYKPANLEEICKTTENITMEKITTSFQFKPSFL